jgi:hypothetical protein
MDTATASDQLKWLLDMLERCSDVRELREAVKAAGITGPAYYEGKIPSGTPHIDRRRDVPEWAL